MTRAGAIELASGRKARKPYAELPLWIMFSGISREARLLYVAYKLHVNEERNGDTSVWARADDIAAMMGYSRGDKLTDFRRELEAIGAVEVELRGMPARNVYLVHEEPEDEWDGIRDLKTWYAMRREIAPVKRANPVPRQAPATEPTKAQVSAVAPDRGEQGESTPVAPDRGQQVAPNRGELDAPNRGGHIELEEKNYPKGTTHGGAVVEPAAAPAGDGMDGEISSEEKETLNAAVARVAELRPSWDQPGVVAIMRKALDAGHKPERVARMFVECADQASGCNTPGAVLHRLATPAASTRSAPAAAAESSTPKRVVDRDDPQCPKHRGELAVNCHRCAADQLADDDFRPGPTMDGADARAAIRAANARSRAKLAAEKARRERARAERAAARDAERAAIVEEARRAAEAAPELASPIAVVAVA
jgi:hypothetical protein